MLHNIRNIFCLLFEIYFGFLILFQNKLIFTQDWIYFDFLSSLKNIANINNNICFVLLAYPSKKKLTVHQILSNIYQKFFYLFTLILYFSFQFLIIISLFSLFYFLFFLQLIDLFDLTTRFDDWKNFYFKKLSQSTNSTEAGVTFNNSFFDNSFWLSSTPFCFSSTLN